MTQTVFLKTATESKATVSFFTLEQEPSGTGLNVFYYNNEFFQGDPVKSSVGKIEFAWFGFAPDKSVQAENYSIV